MYSSLKYNISVDISSRVDTIYNENKKAIYHLFKNYLEARPDSFYNNPYWTNTEKTQSDSNIISIFYKGFYSLQLSPEKLFNNWKPYILTIEQKNEYKYLLRVALISETEKADKILTILNVNAIIENKKWVLQNTFNDVVNSWYTKQFGKIKYVYPSTYIFNDKLANKSVLFCDSIMTILNIKSIDSFTFYISDKPDDMGLLFGYEFYNQNYTTGMTDPYFRIIYSAKGNEYYPHEFVHLILTNVERNDSMYSNYIIEEGVACFLGEYNSEKYINRIYYLEEDYLANKPTYSLHNLLNNSAKYNGYQTAYSTGIIIAEIIFDKKGYKGINDLIRSNNKTEEDIYKTIYKIAKLNKIQFEKAFREKLEQRIKPYK